MKIRKEEANMTQLKATPERRTAADQAHPHRLHRDIAPADAIVTGITVRRDHAS
jgi:hypothetical protein